MAGGSGLAAGHAAHSGRVHVHMVRVELRATDCGDGCAAGLGKALLCLPLWVAIYGRLVGVVCGGHPSGHSLHHCRGLLTVQWNVDSHFNSVCWCMEHRSVLGGCGLASGCHCCELHHPLPMVSAN